AGQRFRLPTWIPGSYLIREFARQFTRVHAHDASGPVEIAKEAKDTWRAAPCPGPLTVIAEVYAYDLSVRTAYLDGDRGFFNGPSVFLCPAGLEAVACELEIVAPAGNDHLRWRVATAMPRRGAAPYGFGKYGAGNYDALIDHPVEMSDFTLASFEAGGAIHDIAISGRHRADTDRLAADLQKVCAWQCDLFHGAPNGRAPFDRYVFLVAAVGEGYGGLEHRASTSLLCKRDELPLPGMTGISADYRTFLGLASHEYFHSWNIKRIKPAAFTPYDLARENYTRQLWAFEGITSYYDDLALVRSGVITIDDFLELLGRTMTTVLRGPGRAMQSVADSSFDAWIKFYRQDENSPNAGVSYYAKGSLVALALDLTLRRHGTSLDALMRALWRRHGNTGIGVPEDGIARLAAEIAGVPLDDFFARYVHGIEDLPLAELLEELGIALHVRAAEGSTDRGGKRGKDDGQGKPRVWIGAKLAAGSEPRLQHVYRGGPAECAGLAAGDVLVAIDGLRASEHALEKLCVQHAPGDVIGVHAFRRDELRTLACTLTAAPHDTCWLVLGPAVGDEVGARRAAWLGRAY
ncbi:MAG: PDZ domain-containing protein, partial [Betaproteobacteria bacterium]